MDWKLIGQQESGEMSIEVDYRENNKRNESS